MSSAEAIARAAIDFGSGAVKIQMAAIDPDENQIVSDPLLAKYTPLSLTEDVASHNGYISPEIAEMAFNILQEFKKEAMMTSAKKGYPSIQFAGAATAVFRKAKNGQDLLNLFEEKLGIRFQILPQEEEGKLGLLTAQILFPDVEQKSLLAWDSGNGSFQMTLKEANYLIYQGPLGHGTARVLLSQDIRHGSIFLAHESGNPLQHAESIELKQKIKELLPPTPEWLKKQLKSDHVVIATFGDGESVFALAAQALAYLNGETEHPKQAIVTYQDVQRVIDTFIEKDDKALIRANLHIKTVTSAIYLSALMQHFGIEKIHYKTAIGNTQGMLLAPMLWENASIVTSN